MRSAVLRPPVPVAVLPRLVPDMAHRCNRPVRRNRRSTNTSALACRRSNGRSHLGTKRYFGQGDPNTTCLVFTQTNQYKYYLNGIYTPSSATEEMILRSRWSKYDILGLIQTKTMYLLITQTNIHKYKHDC